jgi:hypothetical protein
MTQIVSISVPTPHTQGQEDIILSVLNDVVFAGRRWGKTEAGVERIYIGAFEKPGLYWWVGLSWRSASMKRAWRRIKQIARAIYWSLDRDPTPFIKEVDKEIHLPNGSEIWLRSAENPESLAGEGLNGAVLDEFTLMKEIIWVEYLEAALLDKEGWALFMGVPKGNNWGAKLWRNAAGRAGWAQYHFTTYENPIIKKERVDEIRANTAERWFNQEYLAQIIDDAGGVFRRVVDNATADEQYSQMASAYNEEGDFIDIREYSEPEPSDNGNQPSTVKELMEYRPNGNHPENGNIKLIPHEYIFGVDWGQQNDFTVISVIDLNLKQMVFMDRFNKIDYEFQTDRLKALNKKFRPTTIIAERNSMGQPILDRLLSQGLPIRGFTTTNITKEQIIRDLATAFENDEIKIIPEQTLIGELQSYEQTQSAGRWKFSAPSGMHDDTVMSLAIAWFGVGKSDVLLFEA